MSETTAAATEAKLDFVPGEKPGTSSSAPATDAATAHSVLKQVEYYFSDANLPKDKFLTAECAKSTEGWVDLAVIMSFNRIKQLLPSGSADELADALRASKILIVAEDGKAVRRPDGGKKAVTLGGVEYTSRDEVISHARGLIAAGSAAEGGVIDEAGQAFVQDIFSYHEKKAEKEGVGVASIKVGRNPAFPDTSCFVLVRTDETEADFSYEARPPSNLHAKPTQPKTNPTQPKPSQPQPNPKPNHTNPNPTQTKPTPHQHQPHTNPTRPQPLPIPPPRARQLPQVPDCT